MHFSTLISAAVFSGIAAAAPQYGNSGYNGGNSGYNGGNSGYDGGNSNSYNGGGGYNYNNQYTTTTSSTSMMMESSSTSTTMMSESTPQTTQVQATSTPSYGSGSSYWGGSGYDNCVNQCMAQYGNGGGGSYQATMTSGSGGSYGNGGTTHTVIVAPTDGVLRYVPFATNASIGDTVEFHWGASVEHTVTKSSALTPCNKSVDAPIFASGLQGKGFVFSQVVNDTTPTFYYCGVPGHCEKGMYGIINPAQASPGAPSSVSLMINSMASNNAELAAFAAYSTNVTASNTNAAAWGANFDTTGIPEEHQGDFAANVLYTRAVLGMNSEVLRADNTIDLSSVATTPLMLPTDMKDALDAASSATGANTTNASGAAANAAESPAASTPAKGAASSVTSSRFLIAAFVVVATFFAL